MLIRSVGLRGGATGGGGGGSSGPDGTDYYVELTVAAANVGSTLTDYPVYVNLANLPADFWTNVQGDGGDIRVTESDGSTRCPVDLVTIDTTGSTGELHFKGSSLSASSDTTFRIYYGATATLSQPAVTDTYGRNAVWGDYAAVWHMQDDPTGSITDATGNGRDGTPNGGMTSGNSVPGKLAGNALTFDGTDDWLDIPQHIWGSTLTVAFWVRAPAQDDRRIFSEGSNTNGNPIFAIGTGASGSGMSTSNVRTYVRNDSGGTYPSGTSGLQSTSAALDDTWHHVAFTWNNGNPAFYIDGAAAGSDTGTHPTLTLNVGSIAALQRSSTISFLQGALDEMRTRAVVLPADWIAAEYANQSSPGTFYTVGSQQAA